MLVEYKKLVVYFHFRLDFSDRYDVNNESKFFGVEEMSVNGDTLITKLL
jgi:hypothetical protein